MRLLYYLLFTIIIFQKISSEKIFHGCQFVQKFYQTHSNIFQLENNQTYLTIYPLYSLSNQSFSKLSIGLIYRLAKTYLVPVPLLFQCPQSEQIFSPIDCEFTVIDTHSDDLSIRKSESTRIRTVPFNFHEYSFSFPIHGAYFKQSKITLQNCRLSIKENLISSDIFHLNIQYEQTINSSCQKTCLHSQLYQCSSKTNTCQCRSKEFHIEKYKHLCIDTERISNCSLTPERCYRICQTSDQRKIDSDCQYTNSSICQEKLCIKLFDFLLSLPFILIVLLIISLLIIIILIISLIKIRSIKSIQFVHSSSNTTKYLSSICSTLSSSKNHIYEKYTKIHLFE